MGLDMYLNAKKHYSGYSFYIEENQKAYKAVIEALGIEEFIDEDTPTIEVEPCVGYWRKANQIHNWFVRNVQGNNDDCGEYYVHRDCLVALKDVCERVLAESELIDGQIHTGTIWNQEHPKGAVQLAEGKIIKDPTVAHQLLPTQEGFFFGGTDYDEFYISDLTRTIEIINRVLQMPEDWHFYYNSSW